MLVRSLAAGQVAGAAQGRPREPPMSRGPRSGVLHALFTASPSDTLPAMASFDPKIELNPTGIIIAALLFVLAGFGTVAWIVFGGSGQQDGAAMQQ